MTNRMSDRTIAREPRLTLRTLFFQKNNNSYGRWKEKLTLLIPLEILWFLFSEGVLILSPLFNVGVSPLPPLFNVDIM